MNCGEVTTNTRRLDYQIPTKGDALPFTVVDTGGAMLAYDVDGDLRMYTREGGNADPQYTAALLGIPMRLSLQSVVGEVE